MPDESNQRPHEPSLLQPPDRVVQNTQATVVRIRRTSVSEEEIGLCSTRAAVGMRKVICAPDKASVRRARVLAGERRADERCVGAGQHNLGRLYGAPYWCLPWL